MICFCDGDWMILRWKTTGICNDMWKIMKTHGNEGSTCNYGGNRCRIWLRVCFTKAGHYMLILK